MTKYQNDSMLDEALNWVKNHSNGVYALSTAAPTTFAMVTSNAVTASAAATANDWTGPANGDSSGRKITFGARSGLSVTQTATAHSYALVEISAGATALVYATDVTASDVQVLTSGNTANLSAFDIEIADAS